MTTFGDTLESEVGVGTEDFVGRDLGEWGESRSRETSTFEKVYVYQDNVIDVGNSVELMEYNYNRSLFLRHVHSGRKPDK